MPMHSLIFINGSGNVIFSKYFLDAAMQDYNTRLFFEQRLFKQTAPNWNRIGTVAKAISITDVIIVFRTIGDMIVFACGNDDVDETVLRDVLDTIENILLDLLDQKISEAQLLVPDNYGKFVISVDDMMPQGVIETMDAALVGRLSKLKTVT